MSRKKKPFRLTHRHYADLDIPPGGVRQLAADLVARWVDAGVPPGEILQRLEKLGAPEGSEGIERPEDIAGAGATVEKTAGEKDDEHEKETNQRDPLTERAAELRLALLGARAAEAEVQARFAERPQPAPWQQWGHDLDPASLDQMRNACRLPVSVRGAVMPDAHRGYGLPIGGVLATRGAVIPYAVGVDIACRMKLTVVDLPPVALDDDAQRERLHNALQRETQFGIGTEARTAEV